MNLNHTTHRSLLLASVVAALSLFVGGRAQAQAPAQIPIQGFLASDTGVPVTGSKSFLFALYDADTGGTPIFTETQTVMVDGGFFTAYVGDSSALSLSLFRDHGSIYVGVSIDGGSEMTPRTAFGTVPYAAYAEYAGHGASAGSMSFSGSALTNTPATITPVNVVAPSAGMLTVMVTANAFVDCDSTTTSSRICSSARVGICTAGASLSTAACGNPIAVWHEDPDNTNGLNQEQLITFVRTIPVASAGTVSLFVNGQGPEAGRAIVLSEGTVNVLFTTGPALSVNSLASM